MPSSASRWHSRRWRPTSCWPSTAMAPWRSHTSPTCAFRSRARTDLDEHRGRPAAATAMSFRPRDRQCQNDWALVPVSTATVYAFRRKASRSTGVDGAQYVPGSNAWTAMAARRRRSAPGRRPGTAPACLARATARASGCSASTPIAPTRSCSPGSTGRRGRHGRRCPAPAAARRHATSFQVIRESVGGQVGLIWTEGTTNFDVVTAALNTDTTIPAVSMTAPADGATCRARPSPCRRPPG